MATHRLDRVPYNFLRDKYQHQDESTVVYVCGPALPRPTLPLQKLIPLSSTDTHFIFCKTAQSFHLTLFIACLTTCLDIVERFFIEGWKHKGKDATIKSIYRFRFENHRCTSAMYLFHGTRRACTIGEGGRLEPCHNFACSVCNILRNSFSLDRTRMNNMFGRGIYTTPVSSKADIYAKNHHLKSNQHAILICLVIRERPQILYQAEPDRLSPDYGYDSVLAATKDEGGSVDFPETVVYDEHSIVPCGLIMYTRNGWTPR